MAERVKLQTSNSNSDSFKESFELQKLYQEHKNLDEKLREFDKRKYLTSSEELERKSLQKKKLMHKDRMHRIMRAKSI